MSTDFLTFTPYFFAEVFVPLNDASSSRVRFCAGAELRVTNKMSFETYVLHQFKNGSKIASLNAVGVVFKFYLNHQLVKKNISKGTKK